MLNDFVIFKLILSVIEQFRELFPLFLLSLSPHSDSESLQKRGSFSACYASSRVDRCRNDPVGIIVIHTGTHHTGTVIHSWKRHGCNLIEINEHVLLQKLEYIDFTVQEIATIISLSPVLRQEYTL